VPINPLQLPSSQGFTPDITPTLANLVNTINQGQQRQQIAQTLSSLQPGPNGQIDPTPLLKSGNMSLAQLGIGILNNQTAQARDARDFAFRQQESQRAQANSDRSFGLQKESAEKPQYRTIKDASGNDQIISIGSDGNSTTVPVPGAAVGSATNPFAYGGKMNENQSKDAGYANRLFRAEGVLRDPASLQAATSTGQAAIEGAPNTIFGLNVGIGALKNWAHSPSYQKYDQASRDFVNAVLRRESGAAISQSEFENAYKQYLPRPGDSKEVLAEKQRNRQDAIAGIAGGGGPNYRPPFTFDQSGALVRSQNPQQGVVSRQQDGITQEQYNALPPGTPYTAPDGSQRIKR
jgi:hypothetical protein